MASFLNNSNISTSLDNAFNAIQRFKQNESKLGLVERRVSDWSIQFAKQILESVAKDKDLRAMFRLDKNDSELEIAKDFNKESISEDYKRNKPNLINKILSFPDFNNLKGEDKEYIRQMLQGDIDTATIEKALKSFGSNKLLMERVALAQFYLNSEIPSVLRERLNITYCLSNEDKIAVPMNPKTHVRMENADFADIHEKILLTFLAHIKSQVR